MVGKNRKLRLLTNDHMQVNLKHDETELSGLCCTICWLISKYLAKGRVHTHTVLSLAEDVAGQQL